jgi:hypothetical protein
MEIKAEPCNTQKANSPDPENHTNGPQSYGMQVCYADTGDLDTEKQQEEPKTIL